MWGSEYVGTAGRLNSMTRNGTAGSSACIRIREIQAEHHGIFHVAAYNCRSGTR